MKLENLKYQYINRWNNIVVLPSALPKVDKFVQNIIKYKSQYIPIEVATTVPWYVVGCIHGLECSFDFSLGLHNGQPWDKKTTIEPINRGPFGSWQEAAIDALMAKHPKDLGEFTIDKIMFFCEGYNGFGYQDGDGINTIPPCSSPYLYCMTTGYQSGKYTVDHGFSKSSVSKQVGVCAAIKRMESLSYIKVAMPILDISNIVQVLPEKPRSLWQRFKSLFNS